MTTVKALVIQPDGTAQRFTFERGDVRALQEKVGGWIEGSAVDGGFAFWNEEGQLEGLQPNPLASRVVGVYVVGPVVLVGPPDRGEATDITPALSLLAEAVGVRLTD